MVALCHPLRLMVVHKSYLRDHLTTVFDVQLHLLDTRYMVWQQVKPFGPLPHARTNHTLTLVSPAAVTASVTTCEPEVRTTRVILHVL